MGKKWKERQIFFSLLSKSLRMLSAAMSNNQRYGFSNSHVQMWELDHKEDWVPKNYWFLTVVLEKTLESPLDSKEMEPINPKGNKPWIFIGRTDDEAEALILLLSDAKSQLIGKDPDAGQDWGQEEKGEAEDEMFRWHHWLNGHEFEHTLGEWRTGKPGKLLFKSLQRIGHNWVTEQSNYKNF